MNRSFLLAPLAMLFVAAGCHSTQSPKPAAPTTAPATTARASTPVPPKPAPAKTWHDEIVGTYKGTVGGNSDPIVLTFTQANGVLTATYTIDDPQFTPRPYAGKLVKFTETPGKERTLTCRYEDVMNAGSYQLSFSKDFKELTGTYEIDGEGAADENKVTATRQ